MGVGSARLHEIGCGRAIHTIGLLWEEVGCSGFEQSFIVIQTCPRLLVLSLICSLALDVSHQHAEPQFPRVRWYLLVWPPIHHMI